MTPMAKKREQGKAAPLGHRERQVAEAVFRLGDAAVRDVMEELVDPPTYSTVRAILGVLVRKAVLRQRRDGKRYLYRPAMPKEKAQKSAVLHLLTTFFSGSRSDAVAALLDDDGAGWSDEDLTRIKRMIGEKTKSKK